MEIVENSVGLLVCVGVYALGTLQGVTGTEDHLELLGGGVEGDPSLHLLGKIGVRVDGLDRALVDTGIAVNTGVWVDVETVGCFMECVYGANPHAGGKLAVDAWFGDNVGHGQFFRIARFLKGMGQDRDLVSEVN